MGEQIRLVEYMERLAGKPIQLKQVPSGRLKGLSALLARKNRFDEWTWLGQTLVLARPTTTPEDEQENASGLKARHLALEDHFHMPVVLVLPALKAHRRDRLVNLGIPFIVPGSQLFIPPFANLCERYARQTRVGKLSAAAQATVLYQLLRKPSAPMQLNVWAETLRYAPMTLTKVRDELVAAKLCEPSATVRTRGLRFLHQGRELWEKALPSLRSPVARRAWIHLNALPPEGMARAGMTALADLTMIEGDPLPTYACRSNAVDGLLLGSFIERREHSDEANAALECWRYDPCLLMQNNVVDRLSLCLSLAESDDERIRLACAELLEGWTW